MQTKRDVMQSPFAQVSNSRNTRKYSNNNDSVKDSDSVYDPVIHEISDTCGC